MVVYFFLERLAPTCFPVGLLGRSLVLAKLLFDIY